MVVHLVNLLGQPDTLWDAPRAARGPSGPGVVRVRPVGSVLPRIQVADPDRAARLVDLPVIVEGDSAVASLPDIGWWQVLRIDLTPDVGPGSVAVQEEER